MGGIGSAERTAAAIEWRPGLGLVVPRLWPGETVVVAASGPSLRKEELTFAAARARTIVINDVYRFLPEGDMLYAADPDWWTRYAEAHIWPVDGRSYPGAVDFKGIKVTQDWESAKKWGLHHVPSKGIDENKGPCRSISLNPAYIHQGSTSGFQAFNLAVHLGAAKILLMGLDMGYQNGKTHFFGDHPPGLQKQTPFETSMQAFESAGHDVAAMGIDVFNVSLDSHMKCFPKRRLTDVL